MRTLIAPLCGMVLAATLCGALPSRAQDSPAAAPAGPLVIDPETIPMPNLAFTPTPEIEGNYDKYYVFNRADTDFATAYADLQECDGYARGLSHRNYGGAVPYPYAGTIGGVIGGAIGSAMADAIYGSAERRRQRRINMQACMGFKEYRVFGLPKSLWQEFNFEEGNRRVPEERRQQLLQIQARVASGPAPAVGEVRP
jgi:hypothetical protein